MITLIHGDNSETSRAEFVRLKNNTIKDKRELDGKNLSNEMLIEALESQSLFGGESIVFIENVFSKIGKKLKRIEEIGKIIVQSAITTDVVIWEEKEVGTSVIKSLGNPTVKLFKTPVIIFTFLDSLKPNNAKESLLLLQRLLIVEVPEIVFTMIVKRVRVLMQLHDDIKPDGLADWQATRLTTQARTFTMEQLILLHGKLLSIEIGIKTGTTPFTLSQLLEQFIIAL